MNHLFCSSFPLPPPPRLSGAYLRHDAIDEFTSCSVPLNVFSTLAEMNKKNKINFENEHTILISCFFFKP